MSLIRACQTQAPLASAEAFAATRDTQIFAATVSNATASADTLSVWLVPSGGTAVDATNIYTDLPVSANTSLSLAFLVNHAVKTGESIHLQAGTSATALTVTITGKQ